MTVLFLLPVGCDSVFHPQNVKIGGVSYDVSTTDFVVSRSDFNDYKNLSKLKNLRLLDLSALHLTTDEYEAIAAQVDQNVKILWRVPLGEKTVSNTDTHLQLSPDGLAALEKNAVYFSTLDSISVEEPCELTETLAHTSETLRSRYPDLSLSLQSKLYGVKVDSGMEKVVLNKIAVEDLEQLRLAIRAFPNIKTYEMCYCGLSDDVMGGLREEYPDITFIWVVVCERFKVRTDALVFSTLEYNIIRDYNEKTFEPIFKYCTELRALDVGHHGIVDISEIANLKKLQVLILGDNYIQDISPLAGLEDLNYLEIQRNYIKDLSPLRNLKKMEDINLMYNYGVKNASVVTELPHLKRFYFFHCGLNKSDYDAIIHGVPEDCELNNQSYALADRWRWTAKNYAVRKAFSNWKKVKEYRSWDDVVYEED